MSSSIEVRGGARIGISRPTTSPERPGVPVPSTSQLLALEVDEHRGGWNKHDGARRAVVVLTPADVGRLANLLSTALNQGSTPAEPGPNAPEPAPSPQAPYVNEAGVLITSTERPGLR